MGKKTKKNNSLIKRKRLIKLLNQKGITRINKNALLALEKEVEKYLEEIINSLRQEIIVQGRKTLKKEDVKSVLEQMKKEEEFEI